VTRDSRGVAHSWSKHVPRPEVSDTVVYMPRYSAAQVSVRWLAQNAMFEGLGTLGTPRLHVRYEDFVRAPAETLHRAAEHLGLDAPRDVGVPAGHVRLRPNHTVSGNPMRFSTGVVAVSADEAWRERMPANRKLVVAALTLPLRARYGYIGAGREAEPPRSAAPSL
jgi:hypothetical protein